MSNSTPSLNKAFHIVIAVTLFTIYSLLTWVVDVRTSDFISHQNAVAKKVASATALEISTYIQNRRNLLTLLNKSQRNELQELSTNTENTNIREKIKQQIHLLFPELIEFTLITSLGQVILPKSSDFVVGKTCKKNLTEFSQGHLKPVTLHNNPSPKNYHFDVLTHLKLPGQNNIILFISLNTSIIEQILAQRPPLNHSFFLVNEDKPNIIEIAAKGNAGTINRSSQLTDAEQQLLNANIKIHGTNWRLISTFNQSSIHHFNQLISEQKNIIFMICLLAATLVSGLFYRTDKKRLRAELDTLNQNAVLEEKVAIRTKELTYRATHDQLTKLINRGEFERRLSEALALAKTDNAQSVLMYLDLDQFKVVNDTAGHAAGDQLLIQITSLLKSQLRRGDSLARLGGDEFGILLNHCDIDRAAMIAEQLRSIVHHYLFEWESYSFTIGVSIGIIQMNADSPELSELMSLVDAACYMAKDLGRNQYYIYDEDDTAFEAKHSSMYRAEKALTAIKNQHIELHGQKITALANTDDNEYWYEVLVRIKTGRGLIYPDNFIPALERFGHISALDTLVFSQSVSFLAKNPKFKLSINLSGLSIIKPDLIQTIKHTLKRKHVSPQRLCFEITETAAINNLKKVKTFIHEMHNLGCAIALDDFGTGMSSFSYLSNLDIDYIKLDGSFVKDIASNNVHHTMVSAINSIVDIMGKFVIAEYVENKDVHQHLQHIGVSHGQGYFIHRPEKLDDIARA